MTIIVLNAPMDLNKIELLKLRILKDAFKLVRMEHFSMAHSVRNVTKPANYVQLVLIITVLSVQMDLYKMELIYSKAPKSVLRIALQELI